MKINKNFLNLLKNLIKETLKEKEVLLESPVRSNQEIIVEQKINKLLK
jgi:hypothetical protein